MVPTYDSELLRTLVAIADAGSFAKAGTRLHLTQSTISQQMKRLEEQVAQPLFAPSGRQRVLTEAGALLLGYARKILVLHESAAVAMAHGSLGGVVRVGVVQDFAETRLSHALRTFGRRHPTVRLEARVGGSRELSELIDEGMLDIAIVFDEPRTRRGTIIRKYSLAWLTAHDFVPPKAGEPWPLVLFEAPCSFREAGINALDGAGIPWRVVYTSPSLAGLHAAARAGLGVSVSISELAGKGLRALGRREGLPPLGGGSLKILMGSEAPSEAAEELAASLRTSCILRAVG